MSKVSEILNKRYESKRSLLHGYVTSAPMVAGRSTGYAFATVADQAGVRIEVSPDLRTPIGPGDEVLVERIGTPAAAYYSVLARTGGYRPYSDMYTATQSTVINADTTIEPGDIFLGSALDGMENWWYTFAEGRWLMREGGTMHGAIGNLNTIYDYTQDVYGSAFGQYAPGEAWISTDSLNGLRIMSYDTRLFQVNLEGTATFGIADQAEIVIDATDNSIKFMAGGVVQSAIDANSRTIYGFERLGLELGPAIEWGPIADISGDPALERMGFNIRDATERFIGMWSGNSVNPADAGVRFGAQGAEHYFQMNGGKISWAGEGTSLTEDGVFSAAHAIMSGTITASSGTIGGWTIGSTTLSAANVILDSTGHMKLGTGNNVVNLYAAGTWLISAGNATLSSAPFRVGNDGSLYASKVNILAGDTLINADGITLKTGGVASSSTTISWIDSSGVTKSIITTTSAGNILEIYGQEIFLNTSAIRICDSAADTLALFGATGSAQRAYIASPSSTQIRDIFIAFGFMAAS